MSKNPQNIELYKVLYNAYADEIKNLWQRSIFLGAFMVLVWSGYGALQLKAIELKIIENTTPNLVYVATSLGLCTVIIVLSWLWIAMAKGSKFVQEAHEAKIKQYSKRYKCNLFCDLNVYQKATNKRWQNKLSFICPLKSYRYSPSKINIALGWVSFLFAIILSVIHCLFELDFLPILCNFIKECKNWVVICWCLIFAIILPLGMLYFLKGTKKS